MNKKESEELTNSLLIADTLLRLRTIEKLLISKGVFTQEEFNQEMDTLAKQIAKSILEKANVKGDIDEMIKSLKDASFKPPKDN